MKSEQSRNTQLPGSTPSSGQLPTHNEESIEEEEMEELNTPNDFEGEELKASQRPKRKEMSRRAPAWDHFTLYSDENGKQRSKCKYCDKTYAADPSKNGTSTMNNHMKVCKNNPMNKSVGGNQTISTFCRSVGDMKDVSYNWKFDQEASRKSLARMLITSELPFTHVEDEGFRDFVSTICPHFAIPSRTTMTRDCLSVFEDERKTLKNYFNSSGQRLSLTTDTWTSIQRVTYLCLTGHYIDEGWKLHKVILNFIPCPNHKGEEVGLLIEKCLLEWGIKNIFAITVDNASSNDTTVAYLKKRFINWGTAIMGGKYLHMRCVAHVINLVVKDGLKDVNESVERVRGVVRYVRQSPVRMKKFNDFCIEEKVDSKKVLCLDVPTRWNSTYKMLETALIFKDVFDRYEVSDADFRGDFASSGTYGTIGLPTKFDWIVAERFVKVLSHFYKLTVKVSGSFYVISNKFLENISDIDDLMKDWLMGDDHALLNMALLMKTKFDKYWGNVDKMNMMLYMSFMLDPRHKFGYLHFILCNMHGLTDGNNIANVAKNALYDLFEEYKKLYSSTSSTSAHVDHMSCSSIDSGEAKIKKYHATVAGGKGVDSELDRYLKDSLEEPSEDFSILDWWKVLSHRFPVLSKLARDVLAMPISTVASESAFSTGGRIIDEYRSSLTPQTTQALICCQDWMRHAPKKSIEDEFFETIQKIEKEMAAKASGEFNILNMGG